MVSGFDVVHLLGLFLLFYFICAYLLFAWFVWTPRPFFPQLSHFSETLIWTSVDFISVLIKYLQSGSSSNRAVRWRTQEIGGASQHRTARASSPLTDDIFLWPEAMIILTQTAAFTLQPENKVLNSSQGIIFCNILPVRSSEHYFIPLSVCHIYSFLQMLLHLLSQQRAETCIVGSFMWQHQENRSQ